MMRISDERIGKKLSVKSITGMYVGKDGSTYYQVQWEPSWESQSNIVGCEKLIREFHVRQEKEIFGGQDVSNKQNTDQIDEMRRLISNDITELRTTITTKLTEMESRLREQQTCNSTFARRLSTLEESTNCYYYDRVPRQQPNAYETDIGSIQSGEETASREKDDENNELYFEDMLYNEYIEDNIEPRRKRNRGDIAVGIPVPVDMTLTNRIYDRLKIASCLNKEGEVMNAVQACNVRHILALKLAQVIFSNEELAAASYAPGNFKPLDGEKLSVIKDISFMRFKVDETEVKEVSWGQIHQRIKNKCRCKRKELSDQLKMMSSSVTTSGSFTGYSMKDKTSSSANSMKPTAAYSMAALSKSNNYVPNSYNSYTVGNANNNVTQLSSPAVIDLSDALTDTVGSVTLTHTQDEQTTNCSNGVGSTERGHSSDITIICKEDESDYADELS